MAVETNVALEGSKWLFVQRTNLDTTEADAVVLDASATLNPEGVAGCRFAIVEIWYDVQGFTRIFLEWDDGTDEQCLVLAGQGYIDYRDSPLTNDDGEAQDLFVTTGSASGGDDGYTLFIKVKKKIATA